jgi:hypothetical protein
VVGELVEVVEHVKVCWWHHADLHSAHPSVGPGPALVKPELVLASFCANPNQWEHDFAFQRRTVSAGPDFHGIHYEED